MGPNVALSYNSTKPVKPLPQHHPVPRAAATIADAILPSHRHSLIHGRLFDSIRKVDRSPFRTNAECLRRGLPLIKPSDSEHLEARGTVLFQNVDAIQNDTIPQDGYFALQVAGASGGNSAQDGGAGSFLSGNVYFTAGTTLAIVVGSHGGMAGSSVSGSNRGQGGVGNKGGAASFSTDGGDGEG